MDTSFATPPPETAVGTGGLVTGDNGFTVDPFLVEALQNPRHRLTKSSRLPAILLSEIPVAKPSENGNFEHMKVSIKTRPSKGSGYGADEVEKKFSPPRSVEERKEEYEKARERIFSGLTGHNCDDSSSETRLYGRTTSLNRDENKQASKNVYVELEKNLSFRESGPASRVAIFSDREKDRFDPDYDRRYERYIRSLLVNHNFNLPPPFNIQQIPTPYYEMGFSGYNQIPNTPVSLGFRPHSSPIMNPYGTTVDAMYTQWPNAAMMYAHPYEQLRNGSLQVQFVQQPLSFGYMQNH